MRERFPQLKSGTLPSRQHINKLSKVAERFAAIGKGFRHGRHGDSFVSFDQIGPWNQFTFEITSVLGDDLYLGIILWYSHNNATWRNDETKEWKIDAKGFRNSSSFTVGERLVCYWDEQRGMFVPTEARLEITDIVGGRAGLISGGLYQYYTSSPYLYWQTWKSSEIALYDGNRWQLYRWDPTNPPFIHVSATGLGSYASFAIFVYQINGTVYIEASNSTTTTQDGVIVKSGDPTKRWVGTGLTNSIGEFGSGWVFRGILNYYNRISLDLYTAINTGTSLPDTPSLIIAGEGSNAWNRWDLHLHYHSQIDSSTSASTLLEATIQELPDSTPASLYTWNSAWGPSTVAGSPAINYGISLSNSMAHNHSGGFRVDYYVSHSGGSNCDIIEGSFSGSIIA